MIGHHRLVADTLHPIKHDVCARWALVLALLVGCASDPMQKVQRLYHQGRLEQARERLVQLEIDDPGNRHVFQLERGIVELALGQPYEAEQTLRQARNRLDYLEKQDWNGEINALLLDDRQLGYAGTDFEKVLVRAVLAVVNLVQSGGDADAYALQVLEKQRQIIESFRDDDGYEPKKAYKLVAFGAYLRAILNEEDPLKLGVARASFDKVKLLEPSFPYADDDLERATNGKHSKKGNGVVHVLAFVGKGPYRVEAEEPVSGRALAIAQVIWALRRERIPFPNITKVNIPAMAYWRDNPTEVHISLNGLAIGHTATITDVETTARKEFAAMKSYIIARAVLRRALKIVSTESAKEIASRKLRDKTKDTRNALDIILSAAGSIWTGAEQADLRCWSFLPASFQVVRIELSAGEHEFVFRAGRRGHPGSREKRLRFLVRDGFNTYIIVQTPTPDGVPTVITSDPVTQEG